MKDQPVEDKTLLEGHRARLRERYLLSGEEALQDHELLELLLTYAIPRRDTKGIARELIRHFGSFSEVMEASPKDLKEIDGVGERASVLIGLVLSTWRRYSRVKQNHISDAELQNTENAKAYCRSLLTGKNCEEFYIVALNKHMRRIKEEKIAEGDLDHVEVSFRKIAASLAVTKAEAVLLAHNHPASTPRPSAADITLTARLARFLKGMGITVCDHIIVAGPHVFSFCEAGLMNRLPDEE